MQSISVKYVMTRYLCVLVIVSIAASLFMYLLELIFGETSFGTGGSAAVSIILPALDAGTTIYKKWQVKLQGKELWKLASFLTLENFTVGALFVVVILLSDNSILESFPTSFHIIGFVVLIIAWIITLLITRFFLSMGMNQGEKLHQKQTKDVF